MAVPTQGILPMQIEETARGQAAPPGPRKTRGTAGSGAGEETLFVDESAELRRGGSVGGAVQRILHANPETGFHVLRVRLDDSGALVSFVGPAEPVAEGDRVEATGRWERHARYGQQLKARFIRTLVPATGDEIAAFLAGGGVKGVGKRSAEKLRAHFGDRLAEIMTSPTTLMAAGISEKQAEAIANAWVRRTTQTELIAFLQSLSIGPATADRIIKKYGERARQVVTADPYRVTRDIAGLGFRTADQMAIALGFDRRDTRRVEAAILHVMNQLGRDGHCACPRQRIVKDVRDLLSIDDRDIRDAIARLIDRRLLVEEENGGNQVVYEAGVLACEEEIARSVVARAEGVELSGDVDALIARTAVAAGIPEIHEHQALAVRTALGARFCVITGGPGSGKTSSLEVFLRCYEALHPRARIALCAPTGRAAQRMAESTGREAKTIHRLLEWTPDRGGFQRDADNPLEVDVLVVDEASMLDIWLARDVLRALETGTSVVLVGDVDQLPSVGAGRVLGDIIESGVVAVARLTRIFRQGTGSRIAETAGEINAGRMPRIGKPNRGTDMWASWDREPEESLPRVARLVSEIAPSLGYDPLRDIQVLAAGHQGVLGTINLNLVLQEALNPETPGNAGVRVGETVFRRADRIIQTANNYELDVFNGDIGQVVSAETLGGRRDRVRIRSSFDGREVVHEHTDARQLSLAYAISVHKGQGSEFPFVVFVPTTQHYTMLRKTLIYTAVTRARRVCALIGQEKAAKIAVKRSDRSRVTGLARRLAIEEAELERMTTAP